MANFGVYDSEFDRERFVRETHSSDRDPFIRDRARLLHSSSLRRLAAKTQVLSAQFPSDTARTRLTHSLEVAQVGRELATRLRLSSDIVDTACLAHDLGHPPFGHNGELALNDWSSEWGGFEGNAQTFRILSRLEPKIFDSLGVSRGLNLTRASLDASCKYPWSRAEAKKDQGGRAKFGYYEGDSEVFEWMRSARSDRSVALEAQVMDLSDDIAYSVHDLEDSIVTGFMDLETLNDHKKEPAFVSTVSGWLGEDFSHDELIVALERLQRLPFWLSEWTASRVDMAALKNLTSQLIGRFVSAATEETVANFSVSDVARREARVLVPRHIRVEIGVLKGIVAYFVMLNDSRKSEYTAQREMLTSLSDYLWKTEGRLLEKPFQDDWNAANSESEHRRIIVDQVASLDDFSAPVFLKKCQNFLGNSV